MFHRVSYGEAVDGDVEEGVVATTMKPFVAEMMAALQAMQQTLGPLDGQYVEEIDEVA